jgi:Ser/Thr protein kinase RdoA (MazF antagonist)
MGVLRPDYPALLSPAAAARLLAQYWRVEVSPDHIEIRSGAFGTVAHIRDGEASGVLKAVSRAQASAVRLAGVAALSDELADRGLPVPRHRPSCSGEPVVEHGSLLLRLLEWLPGMPYESGNAGQLAEAATMLARLHACPPALAELVGDYRPPDTEAERVDEALRAIGATIRRRDAFSQQWGGWLQGVLDRSRDLGARLRGDLPRLSRLALCHGDYRAQNVGFAGDRLCALYDLDAAHQGSPALDLAYSLVFFPAVVCPRPLTEAEQQTFVAAYESRSPLHPEERAALLALMAAAFVRGLALWLRLCNHTSGETAVSAWLEAYRDVPRTLAGSLGDAN